MNAILHYIHCSETPEIPETAEPPTGMGRAEMEALVVRILEERGYRKAGENQSDGQATQELPEPVLGGELDAAGFAAIADTLAAFRGKNKRAGNIGPFWPYASRSSNAVIYAFIISSKCWY